MIYFAQPTNGGPIKVGHAIDVEARVSALSKLFPQGVEVIATISGDFVTEHFLHHALESSLISNEWYRACVPMWRFLAEIDEGRPQWIPEGPFEGPEKYAVAHFGGLKAALLACGYSSKAGFGDVMRSTRSARSGKGFARLLFTIARDRGELPPYLYPMDKPVERAAA